MTREEAIEELYRIVENQYRSAEKDKEALSMAIEALEQEPCNNCDYKEWLKGEIEQEPCEDAVSRAELEKCFTVDMTHISIAECLALIIKRVKALPSVQPKEIYNKGWKDGAEATAYHVELCEEENPTIPLSVIGDIKAEINKGYVKVENDYDHGRNYGLYMATEIIDKYIAESEDKE